MTVTLYDEVGGRDGLRRLSTAFYDRVLADELLAPVFASFTAAHLEHVAVWLAEVLGGPAGFTASLGGHQAVLRRPPRPRIPDDHPAPWPALVAGAPPQGGPG